MSQSSYKSHFLLCLLILGLSISFASNAEADEDGAELPLVMMAKAAYNYGYEHGYCGPDSAGNYDSEQVKTALLLYENICHEGVKDKQEGRQANPDQAGTSLAETMALAAISDKDFDEAYKWFEVAAEAGRVRAQSVLGAMYRDGAGGRQDCKKGVKWLQKAADGGDAESQYNLGVMYNSGNCVEIDYVKAAELYLKGAEQSHAGSWTNLGVLLINGQGYGQNPAGAYFYWRVASELGNTHADELLQSVEFTDEQRKAGEALLQEMLNGAK
ncbi:MAG: sel1 repeat family protein [Desulfobacteraceae bacterium]|nr:sel1 repeat family protein [Desulfobacteraceae bacterium]